MKKKIIPVILVLVVLLVAVVCLLPNGTEETGQTDALQETAQNSETAETGQTDETAETEQAVEAEVQRNADGLLIVSAETHPELFLPGVLEEAMNEEMSWGSSDREGVIPYSRAGGRTLEFVSGTINEPYELVVPGEWEGEAVGMLYVENDAYVTAITVSGACDILTVSECETLERITLSSAVVRLDITNCKNLSECLFPEDSRMAVVMFRGGTPAMERIELPASVLFLAGFGNIPALKEVVLQDGIQVLDRAFYACASLETLDIPDSVTDITEGSFEGDENLTLIVGHGSAAESYAIENDIPYRYRDE